MKACMVAPTKIIAGLGMSLGIDRVHAPGTTGIFSHFGCLSTIAVLQSCSVLRCFPSFNKSGMTGPRTAAAF